MFYLGLSSIKGIQYIQCDMILIMWTKACTWTFYVRLLLSQTQPRMTYRLNKKKTNKQTNKQKNKQKTKQTKKTKTKKTTTTTTTKKNMAD